MRITRISPLTKKPSTLDLPMTQEQYKAYCGGELIQFAFPHLSDDQREFILNGFLPGEFEAFCGKEDEELENKF